MWKNNKRKVNDIIQRLEKLDSMSDRKATETVLEVMSMTQSLIGLEDLEKILPKEQYTNIRTKLLEEMTKNDYPEKEGFTGQELNEIRENVINDPLFFIVKVGEGEFALRRFDLEDMAKSINFSELNLEKMSSQNLEDVAVDVMKRHRECNSFFGNGILSGDSIRMVLDNAISNLESKKTQMSFSEQRMQEALKKLLMEKAAQLIYPERLEQLKEYLNDCNERVFDGQVQDCALDIIKEINNGNLESAKRMLGENDFYPPIVEFIWKFGKTGPDFLMNNYKNSEVCQNMLNVLANSEQYGYDKITRENERFAEAEKARKGLVIG